MYIGLEHIETPRRRYPQCNISIMVDDIESHKEEFELSDDSSSKSPKYDSEGRSSLESSSAQDGLLNEPARIESQQPAPAEHYVSTRVKLLFLAAYFFLNLFLTLSNKSVLGKVWKATTQYATCELTLVGAVAMAIDSGACFRHLDWMLHDAGLWCD